MHPWPGRKAYYLVHMATTLPAMRAMIRRCSGYVDPRQVALCQSATWRQDRAFLGLLYFARSHFGAGLVSHEMAHAAFRACERKGLHVKHWQERRVGKLTPRRQCRSAEEQFANVLEALVRDFWVQASRHGYAQ